MSGSYPNLLADGDTLSAFVPFDLFAGESPTVTQSVTVASGQTLDQFEVVAMNASGEIVVWDPAATATVTDGDTAPGGTLQVPVTASRAIGIMCQAVDASGGAADGVIYTAGFFNHASLVWPASVTTLAARRAAFIGTPIAVGAVERDS